MAADRVNHPAADAILLDAHGVCARLSIGLSHFHALRRDGRFPLAPVRLGKSVRFYADELRQWTAARCPGEMKWRAMQQAGALRRTG
jgi:predicted DNA-binding transcriptional regulator AlpA